MNPATIDQLARDLFRRETLEKYLPVLLVLALAWLAARGLRKMFWMSFGLFWAFHLVR